MLADVTQMLDFPAYTPTELVVEFCVDDCIDCAHACERCAESCLRGLPLSIMTQYRAALFECGDLAMQTARALARGDADVMELCDLCASLCDVWAQECAPWDSDDFRACAEACRRCAESCRDVIRVW